MSTLIIQLNELCALQVKLTRLNDGLFVRPRAGIGTQAERDLLDGIEYFVQRERLVRYAYQYDGCIHSSSDPVSRSTRNECGQQYVIRCLACAERALV